MIAGITVFVLVYHQNSSFLVQKNKSPTSGKSGNTMSATEIVLYSYVILGK